MKKILLITCLSFISIFSLSAQNQICITENQQNLVTLPGKIQKQYDFSSFYEAYKFNSSRVSNESKGTYFVYSGNSKSTNKNSEYPYLGQIIYYEESQNSVKNLLYISDNDFYIAERYLKKSYGRNYIKYDDYGTIFIAVHQSSSSQNGILMFSPIQNKTTFFPLPSDINQIENFDISSNGNFIVVNGTNGGTLQSHQIFIFDTNASTTEPESLFDIYSYMLTPVYFSRATNAFYFLVTFSDSSIPESQNHGAGVLRSLNQRFSKKSYFYYTPDQIANGENIDYWFNIFVKDQTDEKIYTTSYYAPPRKPESGNCVYELIDNISYLEFRTVPQMESLQFQNYMEPLYKISIKSTPVGLYLKDKWENVYCFTNETLLNSSDDEFNSQLESLNQKFLNGKQIDKNQKKIIQLTTITIILAVLLAAAVFIIIFIIIRSIHNKKILQKKYMQKKILEIQEEESAKLSRDIHDSVIQDIRTIRLQAENIDVGDNQKAQIQKDAVVENITQTIVKMRNICYGLKPAELTTHQSGDSAQIELISIIDTLCQQFYVKTKIPCSMQVDENLIYPNFEKETSTNVVRIFQEILNNIEKHSYATHTTVIVRNTEEENQSYLEIFVIDDGIGCDIERVLKTRRKNHFGLTNMQERMDLIGGKIDFFSSQNEGMKIKLSIKI